MKKPIVFFVELKISAKNKYICEIAEKLFHNDIALSIFTKSSSSQIDNQLWTWKQESFIPHQIISSGTPEISESVLIFSDSEYYPDTDAIILGDPIPLAELQKYKLIIDFAEVYHSDKKRESRQRFKKMRDSDKFDIQFTQLGAILADKNISLN